MVVLDDYGNGIAVYSGARFYGNVETQEKVTNYKLHHHHH
jgi:hypothetical protein